jgi:hypothetical protein
MLQRESFLGLLIIQDFKQSRTSPCMVEAFATHEIGGSKTVPENFKLISRRYY